MADIWPKDKRSSCMSRIRGKDTKPEVAVRSMLHSMGFRFRLHARDLPGAPDIVLPRHRVAIQVNGCFWHRHVGCKYAYVPKSRSEFWNHKFEQNVARDESNNERLRTAGWRVIVVWECELRDPAALAHRLRAELGVEPAEERRSTDRG